VEIRLPPLRERKGDIPLLVEHFLKKYSEEMAKEVKGISPEALKVLMSYDFPGNVRELENIIERCLALESGPYISEGTVRSYLDERPKGKGIPYLRLPDEGIDLPQFMEDVEKNFLLQALERTGGAKKRAAELLGMEFRSFRYRLSKYGLTRE